jgi:cyclopropane fatty-acyl-phospholipid synthase-like methyltransferase
MSNERHIDRSAPDEVGCIYDRFAALSAATALGKNLHAGYWDSPDSNVPFDEAADRLTDIMTEKLKVGPESHVLDVGCGVGGPGVRIAQLTGARVTGISISGEQIKLANSLAELAGLSEKVMFCQENAMNMTFPERFFDAVIALESIMHMPDRGQVLARISRSLRPGGRLVLTDLFTRAPIPAEKAHGINQFRNDFLSSMVQAEDYPPLLRQAGLWFEEILDISEHTVRKSLIWLSSKMNEARSELVAKFGDEMAGRFNATELIDTPEVGYLLVVAKRPSR